MRTEEGVRGRGVSSNPESATDLLWVPFVHEPLTEGRAPAGHARQCRGPAMVGQEDTVLTFTEFVFQ